MGRGGGGKGGDSAGGDSKSGDICDDVGDTAAATGETVSGGIVGGRVCSGRGGGDGGGGVGVGDGGGGGRAGRERGLYSSEKELQGLVEAAAVQAEELGALEGRAAGNATTLVVARPPLAAEFGEFLAVAEAVDDFIDDSGLRGVVQVRCTSLSDTTVGTILMTLMSAFVLPARYFVRLSLVNTSDRREHDTGNLAAVLPGAMMRPIDIVSVYALCSFSVGKRIVV